MTHTYSYELTDGLYPTLVIDVEYAVSPAANGRITLDWVALQGGYIQYDEDGHDVDNIGCPPWLEKMYNLLYGDIADDCLDHALA